MINDTFKKKIIAWDEFDKNFYVLENSINTQIDAKTKLQEFSLKKFKQLPTYKVVSNTGPRHKPLFMVGVKLISTKYFIAEGKSKKDAEQNAAKVALEEINQNSQLKSH